jgi:hypothetical protein
LPQFRRTLLLKLICLFRHRRQEPLIVALHSRAFLFPSRSPGIAIHFLAGWRTPHARWIGVPLLWLQWAIGLCAPLYLLIMQKRIYQQGWPMTVLKYLVVGCCYGWVLATALVAARLFGLARRTVDGVSAGREPSVMASPCLRVLHSDINLSRRASIFCHLSEPILTTVRTILIYICIFS